MSKFTGIVFPFYGLHVVPVTILYSIDSIRISLNHKSSMVYADDRNKKSDNYIGRLASISEEVRIKYDATALNLEQLINSDIKWGLDKNAQVYDLSNKEKFKFKCTKVMKQKNNLIWVNNISYPFVLPEHLKNIDNIEKLHVFLVYIDLVWHIYKFSMYYSRLEDIRL